MPLAVFQNPFNSAFIYYCGLQGCTAIAYFIREDEVYSLFGAHLYAAIAVPAVCITTDYSLFEVEILVNQITRAAFHTGRLLAQPAAITLFFIYPDSHDQSFLCSFTCARVLLRV